LTPLDVAIVTRNRREIVVGALASVLPQLAPEDGLLVVDDGSTDGTADAVRAWLAANRPAGRLVAGAGEGVSSARNLVLAHAAADVVCCLDDDVLAEPGWLAALRRAWEDAPAETSCVGGPMLPEWGGPRPAWLVDRLLDVVAVLDLGPEPRTLDGAPRTGFVWGGNMSRRVEAARAAGGFRTDHGVSPHAPWNYGEDEDLQTRLAAAGFATRWEPVAAVRHRIPPERLTTAYFRRRYRDRARFRLAHGAGRARGAAELARGLARWAVLSARRHPEAPNALFTASYGLALLTARRPRLEGLPPAGRGGARS
jgi:glycosyltransferase involved in cell wall biosynthesis